MIDGEIRNKYPINFRLKAKAIKKSGSVKKKIPARKYRVTL